MDVKVKVNRKKNIAVTHLSFILLILLDMIYNCMMCLTLCYLAFEKDWWATLLLIPFCLLSPSLKTTDDKEDEDGE